MYWLERLGHEAAAHGGELVVLNGNHEYLNVAGRFRYATAVRARMRAHAFVYEGLI
jgi:hypothetical protein